MKDAPLEVWIAEFLKRNVQFQNDCSNIIEWRVCLRQMDTPGFMQGDWSFLLTLQHQYGVSLENWEPEKQRDGLPLIVSLTPPVHGIRVVASASGQTAVRLEEARREAQRRGDKYEMAFYDLRDENLKIIYKETERLRFEALRDSRDSVMDALIGHGPDKSGMYHLGDTLLLAINLRRPRQEIDDIIDEFLKIHLLPPEKRQRFDKWLSYLMVYDLRIMQKSNDEICDIMKIVDPNKRRRVNKTSRDANAVPPGRSEHFFEDFENIENHYENADKLIHGGYKEYL